MPAKPSAKRVPDSRLNARRTEILRTAARIFHDRGFDATSVNDIARSLDMTKAGLYHYFPSKEALLFEIMTFGSERVYEEVMVPAHAIADPEERLRKIVVRHAQISTRAHGAVAQLIDEVRALPPVARKRIKQFNRAYFDLIRGTLRELDAQGRLGDVNPTVAAFSIIGMILWLPRWFRQGGRLNSEQAAIEIANLAVAGVVRQPRSLAPAKPSRRGAK
jgi:TetR/AcrR family transcriptional regulator, cholesterol catabolism regulator